MSSAKTFFPCYFSFAPKTWLRSPPSLRCILLWEFGESRKPKRCRVWMHDILRRHSQLGEFHHLLQELRLDDGRFQLYFQLTGALFDDRLARVGARISRQDSDASTCQNQWFPLQKCRFSMTLTRVMRSVWPYLKSPLPLVPPLTGRRAPPFEKHWIRPFGFYLNVCHLMAVTGAQIPVWVSGTSVCSERVFSTAGKLRIKIKPHLIQMKLIDWCS